MTKAEVQETTIDGKPTVDWLLWSDSGWPWLLSCHSYVKKIETGELVRIYTDDLVSLHQLYQTGLK